MNGVEKIVWKDRSEIKTKLNIIEGVGIMKV